MKVEERKLKEVKGLTKSTYGANPVGLISLLFCFQALFLGQQRDGTFFTGMCSQGAVSTGLTPINMGMSALVAHTSSSPGPGLHGLHGLQAWPFCSSVSLWSGQGLTRTASLAISGDSRQEYRQQCCAVGLRVGRKCAILCCPAESSQETHMATMTKQNIEFFLFSQLPSPCLHMARFHEPI